MTEQHQARKRFGQLFEDPRYELRFKLDPGQLMMFDNNRVLHGRTSFNPAGPETFRWSSSTNPFGTGGNFQNIPSGKEM